MSRNKKQALDAIRLHYLNGTDLTPKHEEIRQRLSAAFALLTNYHSIQQAIPLLKEQYDYSEASAYRDINDAIKLNVVCIFIIPDTCFARHNGLLIIILAYCHIQVLIYHLIYMSLNGAKYIKAT